MAKQHLCCSSSSTSLLRTEDNDFPWREGGDKLVSTRAIVCFCSYVAPCTLLSAGASLEGQRWSWTIRRTESPQRCVFAAKQQLPRVEMCNPHMMA